jgi:hypothetical protein
VVSQNRLTSAYRKMAISRIDSSVPNPARVWDSMGGGRDNFEADRLVARLLVAAVPALARAEAASWAFRHRVVSFLAGEAGIRQFIDIGAGMRGTARCNTVALAQAVAPACRVVYVVNDPVVLSHARATLRSSAEGAISYVDADPRHVESILHGIGETLDLAEPVALLMPETLNFTKNPSDAVTSLAAAVPSGSFLAIIQLSLDERTVLGARRWERLFGTPVYPREAGEVAGWFSGLDLLEPGVVEIHRWRPGPDEPEYPAGMPLLGAVARKQ